MRPVSRHETIFLLILSTYLPFQISDGKLDLAVAETVVRQDILETADFSNFVSLAEVMTTVCYPKPRKALFNILRPFG